MIPQKIFVRKAMLEIDELPSIEDCEEKCIAHAECEGFEYYTDQTCFLYRDISGETRDYAGAVGLATCEEISGGMWSNSY